jgi:hypothetical protein
MHPAAPGHRLTWRAVCARRLARHGLLEPVPPARLAEQVAAMCGAHAQVGSAAELSVGLRVADVGPADVRRALWEDRTLVKTFGPAGTVHLLAAADLARWTGALAATPSPGSSHAKDIALSAEQTDAVVAAIAGALTDRELTADELTEAVVARTGSWAGELVVPAFQGFWPRWRIALHTAAHRGALCFGALRGRKVTYTSPQRWAGSFVPVDGPEAVRWLVHRYLHAYGPATPEHLARWLGVPATWTRRRFAELAGELEPVEVDGELAWVSAGDTEMPAEDPPGVRLLPYFDAYAVGAHPRERLFPGRAFERALARGQAGNFPVVLVDGVVAGVWHLRRSGRRAAVTVEPFARLTASRRGLLDAEVDRIAAFLDLRPELTVGTVTAGGHA